MSKFWSRTAREAKPYTPGEQPNELQVIKLNTNENPYPPSPNTLEAMKRVVNEDLRKYPTPTVDSLKSVIANREGVNDEQVFVGNGSDEVLAFAFQAFFESNEAIKFPGVTYSFYPVYANLYGIPFQEVPLNEDFTINVDGMKQSIGGVIFPNPNAPTGLALRLNQVEKVLQGNPNSVVVVDEAYVEFGAESAVQLVEQYPNLLVTKTLSKSHALAGIRVGYAIGQEELIEGLERIKNSFNSYTINRVSLAGAEAALRDDAYYQETLERVINTRVWFKQSLEELGFEVLDSKANFLFVKPVRVEAEWLYLTLKERGFYIRYFDKSKVRGYVRISVGTDEEMERLLNEISNLLKNYVQ
ncbi:histidinol-phosphate aminotransferase [Alkalibacillus filiformis]|uniref:Histidinol-phosphate aminotransferase n=1 Tax=Alkalibacillus filiformis TaxID=200990 RepID=A0ABU0DVL6_9BACI|nr:histidinol-phosphate transaminase [Alkalibacillus filiformis]MDQ0352195.1 histidinol-phosphate aminotransferase [Alkalibacillus filiformis]